MMVRLFLHLLIFLQASTLFTSGGSVSSITATDTSVDRYGVFELTLTYPTAGMRNPWEATNLAATFQAPSGASLRVEGFYYDTNTYKVRFTPAELGTYRYSGSIDGPTGSQYFSGSFQSVKSASHGFIRRVPGSTNRLQFEDGSFFVGTGLNDCWDANTASGSQHGSIGSADIEPPGEFGSVSLDAYFSKYGDGEGKFNLFRWNPGNCSYNIYQTISTSGNVYDVTKGRAGDILLGAARKHGFHILFTFFSSVPYTQADDGTPEANALKSYFRYTLARYGAYVDIWELTNETSPQDVSDAWMTWTTKYIRSIDPYNRLVTNSNLRPNDQSYLDIQSPHTYGNFADLYALGRNGANLPQVIGESGAGQDPTADSAAYQQDFQRIQLWTAVFGGNGIIWWNGAWGYPQPNNMYLGSRARATNLVLQSLVSGLGVSTASQKLRSSSGPAYALTSSDQVLAYVTRYAGPHEPAPTTVTVNIPFPNAAAEWLDPSSGTPLQTFNLTDSGGYTLASPPFTEDIALRVANAPISHHGCP